MASDVLDLLVEQYMENLAREQALEAQDALMRQYAPIPLEMLSPRPNAGTLTSGLGTALASDWNAEERLGMDPREHQLPQPMANPRAALELLKSAGVMAAGQVPLYGDALGGAYDFKTYMDNPEDWTWFDSVLAAAGALPLIPSGLAGARQVARSARRTASAPDLRLRSTFAREQTTVRPLSEIPRIASGENAGQYIGAPRGTRTPEQVEQLAQDYATRVEFALDSGAQPGWYYDTSGDVIRTLSGGDVPTAEKIFGSSAVVSAGNRVTNERGMSGRAVEQWDMGRGRPGTEPLYAGQYRRQDRKMEQMFQGIDEGGAATDYVQGPKINEYGASVSGLPGALGANDRWEMYSVFGGTPDSLASPTGPQHQFLHSLRERVGEIIYERRGVRMPAKTLQEMNWATAKAMGEKKSIQDIIRNESWPGALPRQTTLQTWESAPGSRTDHLKDLTPQERAQYHRDVLGVMLDEQGRDRLIAAQGASQQMPAIHGPGVYEGKVSPGVTSRSIGAAPRGEVAPVTAARVKANELTRAMMLGQDASAASMILPGSPISAVKIEAPLSPADARSIQNSLDRVYGAEKVGIINTGEGFAVINYGGAENFSRTFGRYVAPDIRGRFGEDVRIDKQALAVGPDGGLHWNVTPWGGEGQSPVTAQMLEAIDNPEIPAMAIHADSPAMRELAGDMANIYNKLKSAGKMPNEKILTVLEAWRDGGLDAVRELVRRGVAPAIAVTVLSQMGGQEKPPPPVAGA